VSPPHESAGTLTGYISAAKGSRRKYSWWNKDSSRQNIDGDREVWLAVRALDGGLNTRNDNVVIKRYASG